MTESAISEVERDKKPISDILDKIKVAEAKVRETVQKAEARKEQILVESKREALDLRERILKESATENEGKMRAFRSEVEGERKKISDAADRTAKQVRANAESQIESAQKHLIEEFMRIIDDQA